VPIDAQKQVLDEEPGDLAGPHAEEGETWRIGDLCLEGNGAGCFPRGGRDREARWVGEALQALGRRSEVEGAAATRPEPIRAGRLVVGPAVGQIGRGLDRRVGQGPIADDGADDRASALGEDRDEAIEVSAGQKAGRHHGTGSACCA
jgi:hypothetical protein